MFSLARPRCDELRVEGHRIALDGNALDIDVRRFRSLVSDGRLDDAVTAYTGDFLSGFTLRDTAAFDEWQAAEADGLRRELAGDLERLASSAEPRRAIGYANDGSRLIPCTSRASPLMRNHARVGERVAPFVIFTRGTVLERELVWRRSPKP